RWRCSALRSSGLVLGADMGQHSLTQFGQGTVDRGAGVLAQRLSHVAGEAPKVLAHETVQRWQRSNVSFCSLPCQGSDERKFVADVIIRNPGVRNLQPVSCISLTDGHRLLLEEQPLLRQIWRLERLGQRLANPGEEVEVVALETLVAID